MGNRMFLCGGIEMDLFKEMEIYLQYCRIQKELDEKTVKAYKIDLCQFITFMREIKQGIDKEGLNQYLVYIHKVYKQKTIKRKIASVKAFFHYLEEEEIIEMNPFHRLKTKFKEEMVLPKIIPKNMIEQLLEYLYQEKMDKGKSERAQRYCLRDIVVVEILFATGLRISELCNLQDKAFDIENGVLCIKGKGRKERYLQIGNDNVLRVIRDYRKVFRNEIERHGFFLVNKHGKPLSEQSARQIIHRYANLLWNNSNITPHMFRHSFTTYLMEEDVNIRYIQKLLGHSSITTTQIYTYVAMEKEREILRTKHPRNQMLVDGTGTIGSSKREQ